MTINTMNKNESISTIETPDALKVDYRFIRLLGEGANGRTWLARDRKNARDVAIKALKLTDDIKSLELFEREGEVLKSVEIRGVPKFYDSIARTSENDTSYIIQEYVDQLSLQTMISEGVVFEESEVYDILYKVALILYSFQTQYHPPIIHRDIKPANILYRKKTDNVDSAVWLIDFGAVANPQKQSGGSTIAGTFGYMAPEQLQGEVSIKSDYYALGATALHLLTGVCPYDIETKLFQLDFHPVIEEKAPKTSLAMISLLDSLLAAQLENRPTSALDLIEMINKARRGGVCGDSRPVSQLGISLEEELARSKSNDLINVDGKIRGVRVITDDLYSRSRVGFELTYNVRGVLYCSIAFFRNHLFKIFCIDDAPVLVNPNCINKVCVSYLESDPSKNRISCNQKVWIDLKLYNQYVCSIHSGIIPNDLSSLIDFLKRIELIVELNRSKILDEVGEYNNVRISFRNALEKRMSSIICKFDSIISQIKTFGELNVLTGYDRWSVELFTAVEALDSRISNINNYDSYAGLLSTIEGDLNDDCDDIEQFLGKISTI